MVAGQLQGIVTAGILYDIQVGIMQLTTNSICDNNKTYYYKLNAYQKDLRVV